MSAAVNGGPRAWASVECTNCCGFGIVDRGYHDPGECPECDGKGWVVRYTDSGTYAKHVGGPLIGRDLKRAGRAALEQ